MMTEIGAYEAKVHFPELLRDVQAGQHFIIIYEGLPIAEHVQPSAAAKHAALQMQDFMRKQPLIKDIDIKALIEDRTGHTPRPQSCAMLPGVGDIKTFETGLQTPSRVRICEGTVG